MKIRITVTTPKKCLKNYAFTWNVKNIDEFEKRFIRDDLLIVGDSEKSRWICLQEPIPDNVGIRMPIRNFVKHDEYVATFDTDFPDSDDICILFALNKVDSPDGSGMIHNVKVDVIDEV